MTLDNAIGRCGAAVHCIKMHLVAFGLFLFASSVFLFMIFFLFSAFSFIASVKVIDDDRIPPSRQNPNLRTRHGLFDAVKF